MMTATTLHPFEAAGLGQAPFSFQGIEEKVSDLGNGYTKAGGTCDFCGTGIRYACHIRSSDARTFVVGMDCARKLDRVDNRLLNDVERAAAKIEAAKREAKRQAKWEAQRLKNLALLQAERNQNGGLTNYEVAQQVKAREAAELAAKFEPQNMWLLDVLDKVCYGSAFIESMKEKLLTCLARDLSDRCRSILCDIYAKAHGRRGSKAYDAASEAFCQRTE